jgi:hypothetical protein
MTNIKENLDTWKVVTILKTNFYKNLVSVNCKAQSEALKTLTSETVPIKMWTTKNGQCWGTSTPENLLRLCSKNNGIYELIFNKFPCKVFFDIDKKEDCDDKDYLSKCKKTIEQFFPDSDMAISGSITPDKISYHIVLNNYLINNENELIQMKHICKYIFDNHDSAFDCKIYKRNSPMKCFNQSKPAQEERCQLIVENENQKKHLITCFFNTFVKPLPSLTNEVQEVILIEQSKTTYNLGTLPKLNLTVPEGIDYNDMSAQDILSMLPLNTKDFDFSYTHLVARFCYSNKINFDTYLSWLSNKHLNLVKNEQGIKLWNALDKFPEVSIERMKKLLCVFYKHLNKDICYRDFADTFNIPEELKIPIESINQTYFNNSEKYSVFNIGMGGGKTVQTINYLNLQPSFIWIAPNKALGQNTLLRMEDRKIDVTHYETISTKDKQKGKLAECNKVICCLNSIHYLNKKTYDVIVIDEIETVIDKFLGDFLGNKDIELKRKIWIKFIALLRSAKKVIFLDAFITTKTTNFIKQLEGYINNTNCCIYSRIFEPTTRTINYMDGFLETTHDIIQKIKNGSKCFIFYPFKKESTSHKSMENYFNMIAEATGKRGKCYNADSSDIDKMELKNVNGSWTDYDFVILNNIVTCGVSYENQDFDYKYLFIAPHNTPRDIIQVSYRARYLSSGIINICYMAGINYTTWLNDCKEINCSLYSALYKSILVEKKAPLKRCFQLFCVKAHYNQQTDKKVINDTIKKEIKGLLDNHHFGYTYKDIPEIDQTQLEQFQQLCFAQEATMLDKLIMRKHYYQKEFTDEGKKETAETGENIIALAWDLDYCFFFDKLKSVYTNDKNIFTQIMKHNKIDCSKTIIPIDITKTKLNKEILDLIFEQFSFKFIDKSSHSNKILKEIYNTYFGKSIIQTKEDKSKNVIYLIPDAALNTIFYQFATNHLIIDKTLNLTFKNRMLADTDEPELAF